MSAEHPKEPAQDQKTELASRKQELQKALVRHIRSLERRIEAISGDIERLDGIETLQRTGRLLLAQASRIPRGASEAVLEDWEMGGTMVVKLNPAENIKSQAEALFKKIRRWQRGEPVMRRRMEEAQEALAQAKILAAELGAAELQEPILKDVWERAAALAVRGLRRAAPEQAAGRGKRKSADERLPYHEYTGAGGRRILVGRGGVDNDALTLTIARPHDLWLHAKGIAGAHVVVPLDKNKPCASDLLVDAATLAAHFSDARGQDGCDVSYVPRRYVRKPRKSPPGAVVIDREKVMFVRIEPARLSRLLATKRLL